MRISFSSVDAFVLQVANAVLRDYIFVHLDDNIDKFNLLMSVSLVLSLLKIFVIQMLFRLYAIRFFFYFHILYELTLLQIYENSVANSDFHLV